VPKALRKAFVKKHLNGLLDFPRTISIEVTNVCNAKCWFCAQPFSKRKKGYIDFSTYHKIINEISQNAQKIKSIALFMDGEPTLHKDLVEFLKYAHELGIEKVNLSSNMEFFLPELTDKLLNLNPGKTLQYIICSLDGVDEETHSQNRIGVDFNKALYNTKYLIEQRNRKRLLYPRIFTRLLVSDSTKGEIRKFKKYWKKQKVDKALCAKMHNWGGQIDDTKLNINTNSIEFIPCYFPFSQLAIQYDGTVRLCCVDTESSVIIGDIKKQSIKEIWNGQIINQIRKYHLTQKIEKLPSICKKCSYPKKGTWIAPFYWV
jgi:radical SAM protein with 4Fe4S-binding SPASM domain